MMNDESSTDAIFIIHHSSLIICLYVVAA